MPAISVIIQGYTFEQVRTLGCLFPNSVAVVDDNYMRRVTVRPYLQMNEVRLRYVCGHEAAMPHLYSVIHLGLRLGSTGI